MEEKKKDFNVIDFKLLIAQIQIKEENFPESQLWQETFSKVSKPY